MSVCTCECECVYICACVCMRLCLCLYVCVSVCLCVCVYYFVRDVYQVTEVSCSVLLHLNMLYSLCFYLVLK